MEKDIGRIEVTSREIKNVTLDTLAKANEFWPWLAELKFLNPIDQRVLAILATAEKLAGGSVAITNAVSDVGKVVENSTKEVVGATEKTGGEVATATKDTTEEVKVVASGVQETTQSVTSGTTDIARNVQTGASTTQTGLSNVQGAVDVVAEETRKSRVQIDSWGSILKDVGYQINQFGDAVQTLPREISLGMANVFGTSSPSLSRSTPIPAEIKALQYLRFLPNIDIPLSSIRDVLKHSFGELSNWMTSNTKQVKDTRKEHDQLTKELSDEAKQTKRTTSNVEDLSGAVADVGQNVSNAGRELGVSFGTGSSAVNRSISDAADSVARTTAGASFTILESFDGLNKVVEDSAKSVQDTAARLLPGVSRVPAAGITGNVAPSSNPMYASPGAAYQRWDYGAGRAITSPGINGAPTNNLSVYVQGANEREQVDKFISELRRRGVDI